MTAERPADHVSKPNGGARCAGRWSCSSIGRDFSWATSSERRGFARSGWRPFRQIARVRRAGRLPAFPAARRGRLQVAANLVIGTAMNGNCGSYRPARSMSGVRLRRGKFDGARLFEDLPDDAFAGCTGRRRSPGRRVVDGVDAEFAAFGISATPIRPRVSRLRTRAAHRAGFR